jgi:hypothetical protein
MRVNSYASYRRRKSRAHLENLVDAQELAHRLGHWFHSGFFFLPQAAAIIPSIPVGVNVKEFSSGD